MDKVLKVLRELRIETSERGNYSQSYANGYTDAISDAIQAVKKFNYTPCCTELKDKEVISFEEWLFVNNYKKLFDYFVKDAISFTESELMQIYNEKVMSL